MKIKKNRKIHTNTAGITMLFSFFVPAMIIAAALANTGIYPGGPNTVLIYDYNAIFLPAQASLRYLINGESSFFFSFLGGLGADALSNYSMYLFNPFSWITVAFPLEKLPIVFYFETLIEIGLCGLAFCVYLLKGRNENKSLPFTFLFSCFYALMSYNVMYQMVLPWLLVVALLPIVLLGIERIIDGKQGGLYLVSMTLSLFLWYQMAYMTGVFSILYILFRMVEERFDKGRVAARFTACSVLSLGLYMPVFLPTIINSFNGRLGQKTTKNKELFCYSIKDVLGQFTSCSFDKIDLGGLPSLFCGSATLLLFLMYFVFHRKEIKKIIVALSIVLFYLLGIVLTPLNIALHGFVEANAFPCRFSYVLCAFIIILAYDSAVCVREKLNIPLVKRKVTVFAIAAILLAEQYINAAYIISSFHTTKKYTRSYDYDVYISGIKNVISHIEDSGFYRVGHAEESLCVNEGEVFGINELDYFSSAYTKSFMDTMGVFGLHQSEHYLEDMGATPIIDGLFGLKYKIAANDEYPEYSELYRNNKYGLWLNEYALSPGFIIGGGDPVDINMWSVIREEDSLNPFKFQEALFCDMIGEREELFNDIQYSIEEIEDESARHIVLRFTAVDEKPVWLYCKKVPAEGRITLDSEARKSVATINAVNGKTVAKAVDRLSPSCVYIGRFSDGEKVAVELKENYYFGDPYIVSFDEERCLTGLQKLQKYQWKISEHANGSLYGKIESPYDGALMMITLPYMKGYDIFVDEIKTGYYGYRGSLVMIPLSEGEHSIRISFLPRGFKSGAVVGIISIILLAMYFGCFSRKKSDK